jgi:UDP-N-acetylmuramoylalanine--D-glutamate ligase
MDLNGRNALVVGLGKSGQAAARLLKAKGAKVIGADDAAVAFDGEVRKIVPESLNGIDLIVKSPGISPAKPIFAEAALKGIEMLAEVELAARFITEPIVGITGTNGKSTTTALTGHIFKSACMRVFAGGNLGDALSNRVLDHGKLDLTVCELSSYQLENIRELHCAAATVLNVTPDHLERYPNLEVYAAAKARIFENQRAGDRAVLNAADARVAKMKVPVGVERVLFDPRKDTIELSAPTLRGAHNKENALAASLLAQHFGIDPAKGLATYPGLPHRLEPVRTLDGVEWINDSKATNVDSVEKSLTAFPGNVILILGGRGKGSPYEPLKTLIKERVKSILTLGEDAKIIEMQLGGIAPLYHCGNLQNVIAKARELAKSGDVVLLSPACASYDQFKSFEDRGDQFKAMVRSLQ